MKAKIFLGGALAALVLGMTACSVDEVIQSNSVMDGTESIAFKATLGHSTRATAVTSNTLREFSVWGWNDDGLFMDHAPYYYTHDAYECDDLYLWPQAGASFIALTPTVEELGDDTKATIDPVGGTTEIEVETPAGYADQIDLCYAVALDNEPNTFVTLNFRHALSQIVFKAVNNNSDITVDVAGVSLHSIRTSGKYTLPSATTTPHLEEGTSTSPAAGTQGTWAVGEPDNDSKFVAGMAVESKTLTSERESLMSEDGALFLIPQTTAEWDVETDPNQSKGGAYFLINCQIHEHGSQLWPETVGEFGEVAMPVKIDWEEGYRYTYTFIFGAGAGYYPPDDPNSPGEPVFNLINFEVTVDEFQDAGNVDVSTEVDDSDGSLDKPYSVSKALEVIEAGVNTADTVYVKGVISEISEVSPLATVTAGHATYYMADAISDTGGAEEQIMVFDGLSLGGVEFASNDEIAVGDEVIVYGILAADEDETPEITESIIYSLNGQTYEEPEEEPEPEEEELVYGNDFDATVVTGNTDIKEGETCYQNEEGSGIENVTYGYSGTMSVRVSSNSSGYTNASGDNNIFFGNSTNEYFIIKDITLPTDETDFKLAFGALENASFSHDTFKVYVSEDKISWVEVSYEFEDGDPSGNKWGLASTSFTVPSGTETLSIYYKSTKASSYRIDDVRFTVASEAGTAIDFSTGVELDGGDQEPEEHVMVGDGTEDNPYTASDAIALVASGSYPSESVYITGIVSQIGSLNSDYGELNYYLSDDGTTDNQLYVYNGYGLGGAKIESADYLTLGDELVIYGKLTIYSGSAEVNYGSKIISINGQTAEIVDATAAEVNAGSDGTTYRVAGYITSVANTTYGNFYLKDYTGQTYIYGTLDASGNTKNWESLGISAGDIVKVHGPKSTYGSTAELTDVTVDEHYAVTDVTIAEFNAASVSTEVYYRLTGTVTSIANSTYGNLYLEDETASVYVYGLPCGYGGADSTFPDTGVAQGDKITIVGTRGVYGNTIEVLNGFYVETVSSGSSGGDNEGKYYVKVTEELSDWTGTYLIVNDSAAAAFDGSSSSLNSAGNYKTVTISDGKIAYDSTSSSCQFTIEPYGDGYSIKGATNYIYHSGSSNTINYGTTAQANLISYDSSNSCALIQQSDKSYMLRFNSSWIGFRFYTSGQQPVQLYKLED